MIDPVVRSALITLVAFLLYQLCVFLNVPISPEVLTAVAAALVAWLLGDAAANRLMRSVRG